MCHIESEDDLMQCVRVKGVCSKHGCSMAKSVIKERAWRQKKDGLYGNKLVSKVVWKCNFESSPKIRSTATQEGAVNTVGARSTIVCGGKLDVTTMSRSSVTNLGIKRKFTSCHGTE